MDVHETNLPRDGKAEILVMCNQLQPYVFGQSIHIFSARRVAPVTLELAEHHYLWCVEVGAD